MKLIIRTCQGREGFAQYLKERLAYRVPTWIVDQKRDAMDTFIRSLEAAGTGRVVHMEDDILLCKDFEVKINAAILEHPSSVIQFFSMRGADLTQGSRWEPGRTFLMNQCFYLPEGYSADLLEFAHGWTRYQEHPTGYDILMQDWLKSRKERYWLHVPSLVQHRDCKSEISPRRSSRRQSTTFEGE